MLRSLTSGNAIRERCACALLTRMNDARQGFYIHDLVFRKAYTHLFGDQELPRARRLQTGYSFADNTPYISFLNNKKMLMHRRARYRLGSVYEIINNRVSPDAIIFTSTLLRRYTFSPGYTFCVARFVIYVQYVTSTIVVEFYCRITCRNSQNSYCAKIFSTNVCVNVQR